MAPRYEQKNPGVSDAYLKGNIGRSLEIQSSVVPPAPPLTLSSPNGVVVAQAEVVGGDPIGLPLSVTIRAPENVSAGGRLLKATIEWGSGGFQPSVAQFDVRHSQVVEIQGSWVRVKVINNLPFVVNLAAFIAIGGRPPGTDPVSSEIFAGLIAAGTVDFTIPEFAKDVQVFTDAPAIDTYDVLLRNTGGTVYSARILAGVNGSDRIRVSSIADTVRVSNIGGAAIANGIVFFGVQL